MYVDVNVTSCTIHRHARWCHGMRMSFSIQKSMITNMYLQGRIEIDATLCECLTDFRNITEQEFGGSFASFVTLLCNSDERGALLLLYLNLTEEIYKMGHSPSPLPASLPPIARPSAIQVVWTAPKRCPMSKQLRNCCAWCKAVRPNLPARFKMRLHTLELTR